MNAKKCIEKGAVKTHFLRSCVVADIQEPFSLSDDEIGNRIEACKARLRELKAVAPMLRIEHLRDYEGSGLNMADSSE